MGFNTRYVSEETIMRTIKNEDSLKRLFSSDAIIFLDEFSTKVYDSLKNGFSEKEIIKSLKYEKRKKD